MQDNVSTGAAEIIRDLAEPQRFEIEGRPVLVFPEGSKIKEFPELFPPVLTHTKAKVIAHDFTGFIDYVNAFKNGVTRVFAALEPKPKLLAFIDYHEDKGAANFCAHSVICEMPFSEEWKRWTSIDSKPVDQKTFGTFLEDNLKDVIEPTGASLMQAALNFTSMREVEFGSSTRLSSGEVQFAYKEKEKTGEVKLPERIKLALPVFRGDTRQYAIFARVKYKLDDKKLAIWIELERPDLVIDASYANVLADVADKTEINPFRGMPLSA